MRSLFAVCIIAAFAATIAYGQSSTITLYTIPDLAYAGDVVTFEGVLTGGGSPLPNRTVWICEDDPFIPDECLAYGTTDHTGRFSIPWVVKAGTVEIDFDIYAEFDGDSAYRSDQTPRQTMSVYDRPGSTLVLNAIPDHTYAGDTVVFSGVLTSGGSPLPNRTVWICEDDPFIPDECLAYGTTDHTGRFSIPWVVKAGTVEIDFDIYAEFDGDAGHGGDQSPRQTMSVYKRGGMLTLDPIPTSAAFGKPITLSGTLTLDGRSPEGAIIYIQDEDTLGFDDLLVTTYADAAGRFSTYWVVEDVDPNNTIEIRAVFEGNSLYSRQTSPIQKLRVYADTSEPDPAPVGPAGYMELYRSLDFERAPLVLIAPSPDSYDEVKRHILPVQEGILQLTAMLEQQYGQGNWAVEFEVAERGKGFVNGKADITVSLVTRDDDSGCDWDRYGGGTLGWAYTHAPKPVPTVVCSLAGLTDAQVAATAVHEFIHAIGVGHTFNIPGDLLCSVEEGYGQTCPGMFVKSTIPSGLNLAAVAAAYGTDGFQNPNNPVTRGQILTLAAYRSGSLSLSPGTAAASYAAGIQADRELYGPGDVVLLDGYSNTNGGPFTVVVTDRYGAVADTIHVGDGRFEAYAGGYYTPGTYNVNLYDGRGELAASTAFEVADDSGTSLYDALVHADYAWYFPGEAVIVDGLWGHDGPASITVVSPDGYAADRIRVYAEDGFFEASTDGYYMQGAYAVWLFDDAGEFKAATAFHVMDFSEIDLLSGKGHADAEHSEYDPGESVMVNVFYWEPYHDTSGIEVLGPDGHAVASLSLTGSDFGVYVGRYYEPGVYTVLLRDDSSSLVSSSTFRVVGADDASLYSATLFTDYTLYYPGKTVLLGGFWDHDGSASMTVVDPNGYVIDEIHVTVEDGSFDAQTIAPHIPGAYVVWLHDDAGTFVSGTGFHVINE